MKKSLLLASLLLLVGAGIAMLPSCAPTPTSGTPTIVAFSASPSGITSGESATLLWNITNATSVQIDQGVGSGLAVAGTISVSPSGTTTYTLTASNSAGSVTQSVTVTVTSSSSTPAPSPTPIPPSPPPGLPPVVMVFDIIPNTIHHPPGPGPNRAVIRWEVRYATTVTINGNPEPHSGNRILTPPLGTHMYTLRATNAHDTVIRIQVLTVTP